MKTIDLSPSFQRNVVWSPSAQAYLIDTLLRRLPIPKIYIKEDIDNEGNSTYRVVDGQQRLTAIFRFLNDELALEDKYSKDLGFGGKRFTGLPPAKRQELFEYKIDVEFLPQASKDELKDMFARLNRTGAKLNKQELRHAAYEGDFIQLAEEFAKDPYWTRVKLAGTPQIRRMLDVEFVSELLMMVSKNQLMDRKKELDSFYADNEIMGELAKKSLKSNFRSVLNEMKKLVTDGSTRFSNKGDFYSLFYTIHYFKRSNYVLDQKMIAKIKNTLSFLTVEITSQSSIDRFRDYYVSTQQAVDSYHSRSVRHEVLKDLFEPMMTEKRDARRNFTQLQKQIIWIRSKDKMCFCGKPVESFDDFEPDHIKPWREGGRTEIFNGRVAHRSCNRARRS